jgi:YgiT-type zinc finger domain-containing protein
MKCVICHGDEIIEQRVEEEIRTLNDIVLAPISCLVCQTCGERYYDTDTMLYLEKVRAELRSGELHLKQVGKVMAIESPYELAEAA